jgi:hypothetical protein
MTSPEIRNAISAAMQHMPLCQTQRKDNPDHKGPCTCYHEKAVSDLHLLILQIIKGNR